jgi:RNA polymerase sigma-70 factor (ECF subfamily)
VLETVTENINLVNELQNGSEWAFRELVQRYQDIVVRTAFAYLKNKDEAEDLAQEVFIAVYENISSFRNEANLKTWIYRITINKSINQIRKLKWKSALSQVENILETIAHITKDKNDPYSNLVNKEQELIVQRAMNKLPESQQTAFILHKYDDLSHQEIAKVMNISIPAVESLIHRAKMNLQKNLIHLKK